jgi:hypothetical protein
MLEYILYHQFITYYPKPQNFMSEVKNDKDENKNERPLQGIISSLMETFQGFFLFLEYIVKQFLYLTSEYIDVTQKIQLSFIYFFALVDLTYSIFSNILALGYFPDILNFARPLLYYILNSKVLQIWASPEKVFLISYFTIEFLIIRKSFKLTRLVRYNILLLFSLLMIQGITISFWDVLFHRDMGIDILKWTYDQGALLYTDKSLGFFFFFATFVSFIFLYIFLYLKALQGKFATFPGGEFLTDSVCLWLKIRTPSMRFGKRKKKGKGNENRKRR